MWRGTAASVVDLHPTGFLHSDAFAASELNQVGAGTFSIPGGGSRVHALLWSGTAESVVDINPDGIVRSIAQGVNEDNQVGYGSGPATGSFDHAFVWSGTAESAIDLHPYLAELPVELVQSFASAIEANGSIIGWGEAGDESKYTIIWTPIPEPHTFVPSIIGCVLLAACSARRTRDGRM